MIERLMIGILYVVTQCKYTPSDPEYKEDLQLLPRLNQDLCVNDRGKNILDLCTTAGLRILNGRTAGDSLGFYTCHKYNGSSTVDYAIVSEPMMENILYFHVSRQLSDLSDHCQISLCIKYIAVKRETNTKVPLTELPNSFKWNQESKFKFQQALNSVTLQEKTNQLLNSTFYEEQADVEEAVKKLNQIYCDAASISLRQRSKPKRKRKDKEWFNNDLAYLRKQVRRAGFDLCKNPHDP
jgi:hypothetical protein